jgi:hypothetical protein
VRNRPMVLVGTRYLRSPLRLGMGRRCSAAGWSMRPLVPVRTRYLRLARAAMSGDVATATSRQLIPTALSYRQSVRFQGWIDKILSIGEPQASSADGLRTAAGPRAGR